ALQLEHARLHALVGDVVPADRVRVPALLPRRIEIDVALLDALRPVDHLAAVLALAPAHVLERLDFRELALREVLFLIVGTRGSGDPASRRSRIDPTERLHGHR